MANDKQFINGAIRVLQNAQETIANGHWTVGTLHTVTGTGKDQYCAIGAIEHNKKVSAVTRNLAKVALAKAINPDFDVNNIPVWSTASEKAEDIVTSFNDLDAGRARAVQRKMSRAIRTLKSALNTGTGNKLVSVVRK